MSLRMSELEYHQLIARREGRNKESSIPANVPKESKYHAVLTEVAGMKLSKKEARFYLELVCRQKAGEIKCFVPQVPFRLPGKTNTGRHFIHKVDFLVIYPDDRAEFVEVKGRDLELGKLKRRQVEEIYNLKIRVV